MEDALAFTGDRVAAIDEIPGDHPGFIMGHCFKAGMLTQAMEVRIIEVRIYDDMLASVEAAEALGGPCE